MTDGDLPNILAFIRRCVECHEESKDVLNLESRMWERKLTLNDLRDHAERIPQARIQEENVRYGMAYCKAESKEKSIRKLTDFLKQNPNPFYLSELSTILPVVIPKVDIQIDDDVTLSKSLPNGKTKEDLIAHIYSFFH